MTKKSETILARGASEFLARLFTSMTERITTLEEDLETLEQENEHYEQENADLHLKLDALRSSYAGAPSQDPRDAD